MLSVSFDVFAIAGLVTALGALLFAYAANGRLRARSEKQQDILKALQADVAVMCSGAVKLGEHLAQQEQRLRMLGRRQDELELHEPSGDNYRHAARLMGKGVELEEVMEDCGLARGEAELLVLAQKLEKAS